MPRSPLPLLHCYDVTPCRYFSFTARYALRRYAAAAAFIRRYYCFFIAAILSSADCAFASFSLFSALMPFSLFPFSLFHLFHFFIAYFASLASFHYLIISLFSSLSLRARPRYCFVDSCFHFISLRLFAFSHFRFSLHCHISPLFRLHYASMSYYYFFSL